jgi:hypothetical protein
VEAAARSGWADDTVSLPPLALNHHAITMNEQQVAACYENPMLSGRPGDIVERLGEVRGVGPRARRSR